MSDNLVSRDQMATTETMWAEMKPNTYSGDSCEEHKPGWYAFAAGDRESEEGLETLDLHAATFPPGTKVVVMEPVCPNCGEVPGRSIEPVEITGKESGDKFKEFTWSCGCDFNWREWANREYS